jgi:hypothetical protein
MQELKFEGNGITAEIIDDAVRFMSFEAEPSSQWPSRFYSEDKTGHACCPDCGGGMVRLGSCFSCPSCGYQSCGG